MEEAYARHMPPSRTWGFYTAIPTTAVLNSSTRARKTPLATDFPIARLVNASGWSEERAQDLGRFKEELIELLMGLAKPE